MKSCTKCRKELSLDHFHPSKGRPGGSSRCIECTRQDWKDRPSILEYVDPPEEKPCNRCGKVLPASSFTKNSHNKTGLHSECRQCSAERLRERKATLVIVPVTEKYCKLCDRILDASEFAKSSIMKNGLHSWCKECNNMKQIERRYKITPERYREMVRDGCQICGSTVRLVIDHDHSCCPSEKSCGECVRGILCDDHNNGLGRFSDDPSLLLAAVEYLQR